PTGERTRPSPDRATCPASSVVGPHLNGDAHMDRVADQPLHERRVEMKVVGDGHRDVVVLTLGIAGGPFVHSIAGIRTAGGRNAAVVRRADGDGLRRNPAVDEFLVDGTDNRGSARCPRWRGIELHRAGWIVMGGGAGG